MADLEYSEPIEVASFSPSTVLSGDVLTITGEYLNNVMEVIFSPEIIVTDFISKSRYEIQVAVPSNAVSGYVIVGDVNEIEDANTIPNRIYTSEELVVSDPTVVKAESATYKAGDVITVSGEHLDMIETINLNGASDIEFTVAEDGTSISFSLPASATDGQIVLVSYAGTEFQAGDYQTVTVASLGIASNAEDGRYKAGSKVTISGSDLDLVSKVEFTNAEASYYFNDGDIIATIPGAAKDGVVTLTLESGKQATTDAIEVVKPVITGLDKTEAIAGDVVAISGTDLDLVSDVKIGDKANSFIPCEFSLVDQNTLNVTISRSAYTGPLTVTAENGYESVSETITVGYSEPVAINFTSPSFALGKAISITGEDLLKIENIYLKGNKVSDYLQRENDAMTFAIPEGVGPGVYRLDLSLFDGTELTWPVPFEITASYTETFIWEGYEDLGSWSNQPYIGPDGGLLAAGVKVGDVIRIYYTTLAEWWQFQIYGGHWEGMTFPELGGSNTVSAENAASGSAYFAFEVTEDNIEIIGKDVQWWGGALLCQGENVAITGLSLIQFGAAETTVWEEDPVDLGAWSINWEMKPATMFVDAGLTAGMTLYIYVTPTADWWQIQFFDGHWGGMDVGMGNGNNINAGIYTIEDGRIAIPVTADMAEKYTTLTDWGYCGILQGESLIINKITIM